MRMPLYEKRNLALLMLLAFLHIYLGQFRIVFLQPIIICCALLLLNLFCFSQASAIKKDSSSLASLLSGPSQKDSFDIKFDSLIFKKKLQLPGFLNIRKDTSLPRSAMSKMNKDLKNAFAASMPKSKIAKAPFLKINGGSIGYGYDYRSTVDTPFIYNNLYQHHINGDASVTIAGKIPLRISLYARRSNSAYFKDITDVQVAFDPAAYRNQLGAGLQKKLEKDALSIQDSLSQQLAGIRQLQAMSLNNWLNNPQTLERLVNAHEILNIAKKAYDPKKPDSSNKQHADSLQKNARTFIALYEKTVGKYHAVSKQADSLKRKYDSSLVRYKQFQQLLKGQIPAGSDYNKWKKKLDSTGSSAVDISSKDRFLLGVRSFGLGRSVLNYSDLTVKNISITGINFEYNSWYYMAFAAGLVDYRFRDFIVTPAQQGRQYLYLARLGLGKIERNYFIVTAYHGQKQLFANVNGTSQFNTVQVTGFAAETKWQLNANTFAVAEAAQSFSPNFQTVPATISKWTFSDKSNKALSLKISSYFPSTLTKVEGMYKFMGANFQSFNSFQTNSQVVSWYVKADQSLFKRKLKISASVRSNDFSNPYIIQNYKANTVFESISATFKSKGLPTVSLGYMPITQLTMIGNQLAQSQFQTLNASISHFYKIGQQRLSTSVIYTKFYNTNSDSGFIYYNSNNLYIIHSLFFNHFTTGVTISHSQNSDYNYNVMEGNFNVLVSKRSSLGGGIKINNLYHTETKLGGYGSANISITKKDVVHLRFEDGYLPGNGNRLVGNTMANISYTRMFR
jgi:hypothetical protein